jgi:hypothetical protein
MNGFTKKGFLNIIQMNMITNKSIPPHKNPMGALPRISDINQEKEMTKNNIKNSNMKLVMNIRSRMLNILESTLMLVSLKISNLVSK